MRRYGVLVLVILTHLLNGCVTPPVNRKVPFRESDFANYGGKGSARIVGQAFLKTRGGDVKFGAGNVVHLVPATGYSLESLTNKIGTLVPPTDARFYKYVKQTRADGNGNFAFTGVPAGKYIVTCKIAWEIPSGSYTTRSTGGTAMGTVTVARGQTAKVILTR